MKQLMHVPIDGADGRDQGRRTEKDGEGRRRTNGIRNEIEQYTGLNRKNDNIHHTVTKSERDTQTLVSVKHTVTTSACG